MLKYKKGDVFMEIVIATNNKGKAKEIKDILKDLNAEIYSLKDKGIDIEIEETGETFEENAFIKAEEIFKLTNSIVVADDSGLEVDVLDGAPGVYSARYAGENATDKETYEKLLRVMEGVPYEKRTARFVSVVAVILPDGTKKSLRGECEGVIINEPKGEGGFGYDPVFLVPEYNKTFSELTLEEKNAVSHRGKAFNKLKDFLLEEYK